MCWPAGAVMSSDLPRQVRVPGPAVSLCKLMVILPNASGKAPGGQLSAIRYQTVTDNAPGVRPSSIFVFGGGTFCGREGRGGEGWE